MNKEVLVRTKEYQILEKRINSFLQGYKQNLALLGPSFSGKTHLIETFLENNLLSKKFIFLYTDLEFSTFPNFTFQVFSSLLFYYLKQKEKFINDYNLDTLILESQEFIPKTIEKIKSILTLSHSKERASWEQIAQVLDTFTDETQQKLIFVIENFTLLKNFSKKFLLDLAKYITLQKNIMFIFISRRKKEAENILSEELNLIFGSFEKIYLGNFSPYYALTYLNNKLGNRLEISFKKFLIELTDGFPLYLEIITNELLKVPKEKIEFESFIKKLSYLLNSEKSCLYQIFKGKLNLIKQNLKNIFLINPLLILISSGYTRKKELASLLKTDSKNLNNKLSKLTELNILNKNGSFYFLPNKLFSFWLSSVFKIEIELPLVLYNDKEKIIEKKIKEKFEESEEARKKDSFQRFLELVQLFKDDTIKTGKKLISLPHIKRLKIVPARNKNMKFIIGEAKRYYLILAFKEDIAQDTDILEFSTRCSYFRNKQPKKIFITLGGADYTAKLLAKEKRLYFWEREEVNFLLKLYNKPLII